MQKRKLAMVFLLIGSLILTLVACQSSPQAPSQASSQASSAAPAESKSQGEAAPSAEDVHIAVIFKTLSSEYWKTMESGSQKAAEELGIKVTILGPNAESEIAQQVTQIEEQLSAGVDAIVVAPCEENAVIGALTPAVGKIPVLLVDSNANLEGKTAFIGTGNEAAAKLGGEYAAKLIGQGGKAILIGGQQGEMTSSQRLSGFRKGLEENGAVVLEEQYGNNTADKAMAVMEDLLTKYPDEIDAVLSMNDDMAIGVQQACANAGIDDIVIVGFDANQSALQLVKEGKLAATVAQQPYLMGYQAVQEAYKAVKGEHVEPYQEIAASLVTIENVDEYLKK